MMVLTPEDEDMTTPMTVAQICSLRLANPTLTLLWLEESVTLLPLEDAARDSCLETAAAGVFVWCRSMTLTASRAHTQTVLGSDAESGGSYLGGNLPWVCSFVLQSDSQTDKETASMGMGE